MYKIKIIKEMEKLDESFDFQSDRVERIINLEINETEETLEIISHEEVENIEEPELMDELKCIFDNIVFEKTNYEISNIEEISKKWQFTKKDMIFKNQDNETISFLMLLSKFYENEKTLSNIIKKYSFIPFLVFFYKNKNTENREELVQICNIFMGDKVDFNLKLETGKEENEYMLTSNLWSQFGLVDYEIEILEVLELPRNIVFSPNIELKGKYIYSDRLESMKIEIKITLRDTFNYTKTIEIY